MVQGWILKWQTSHQNSIFKKGQGDVKVNFTIEIHTLIKVYFILLLILLLTWVIWTE